jgi:hypothetical protein
VAALMTGEFDHVGVRGSHQFAARLTEKAPDKLLGLCIHSMYIQPSVGRWMYGDLERDRDSALWSIAGALL